MFIPGSVTKSARCKSRPALDAELQQITFKVSKKEEEVGEGGAMDSELHASRLEDLNIKSLRVDAIGNPVILIHAPRESGGTRLIASLLSSLPDLDAAVVLTDRAGPRYMEGALPEALVLNKPPASVLKQLIRVQQHRLKNFPDEPMEHLALALDDIMYTPKLLRSADFQSDIKLAKHYNVTIIMVTADMNLVPNNVHTFATHVLATKCLSSDEPKLLQRRMFVMFENGTELNDHLVLCRPYEFLVGLLRPVTGPRSIENMTRSFVCHKTIDPLVMQTTLVEKLSLALDKL